MTKIPVNPGSVGTTVSLSSLGRAISLKRFWERKVLNLKSYGSILLFVTVMSSVRVTKVSWERFVLLVASLILELFTLFTK